MEINTKEYWNNRVIKSPNEKDMLFLDARREVYWTNVHKQIAKWEGSKLDLCCGYGQFSQDGEYLGVDFSEEMIKLAKTKYPDREFKVADVRKYRAKKYDIIYEVNSLHSMGMTPEEFYNKFKKKAKIIACLEADSFFIWENGKLKVTEQIYGSR